MTNPFIEQARAGNLINDSTGNPFLDQASPHGGKDYDSMAWAIGKTVLGGILSPVTGFSRWGRKLEESGYAPHMGFSILADLGDSLQPNLAPHEQKLSPQSPGGMMLRNKFGLQDEDMPTQGDIDKTQVGAIGLGANLVSGSLAFKGIGGALDAAISRVPSTISTRVGTAIAKVAEGITLGARRLGASEELANIAGNTALALPKNVAIGMATDIATNPDQSKQGLATNALLTSMLSVQEGYLYRKIPKYLAPNLNIDPIAFDALPREVNENVPDYLKRVQDAIGKVPKDQYGGPRTFSDVVALTMDRTEKLRVMEKELKDNYGVTLPTQKSAQARYALANGMTGYIQQFGESPFTFSDDGNIVRIPGPDGKPLKGLTQIMDPIDTPELQKKLDAYSLSKTLTDKAQLGTYREKYKNTKTRTNATIVGTAGGKHYIDYPDRAATHPDLKSAQEDLKNNGYEQMSTSLMPSSNEVKNGIDIKDHLNTIKYIDENYPQVAQAHAELMQHSDALDQFMLNSGLATERGVRMMRTLQDNHISLESLLNDGKIVPPTYSYIHNVGSVIIAGVKNMAKRALTDIADEHGSKVEDWIKKEKIPDVRGMPLWQTTNKVMENLKQYGLDYVDREGVLELVTKMSPHVITPIDDNWSNLYSYKDGYVQKYSINSDLAKATEALNPAHIDLFTQLLGLPARGLSTGITKNPIFGLVHAIRDTYNSTLNSDYNFFPFLDSWRGFKEAIGKGKYGGSMNAERVAAGGGFGTIIDAREMLSGENAMKSILPLTAEQRTASYIKHPIEFLEKLTRPFLEAGRIGEYMKAREAGASAMEAALHSRTFIGDFGMKGTSPQIQRLAYITAFMNPGLQSLRAESHAMFGRGVGGGVSYAVKGMMAIGLPTLLNYVYNAAMGDEDISKARQTQEGSTYWFTKLPGGKILKSPKPFLPGQIFGTAIETALDKFRGQNPDGFKQLTKNLLEASEFSIVPSVITTGANLYANRDNFSGRPIIPSNLEGIDPQYQQTPSTSNLSKAITSVTRTATLGKVNISPITMDYVLRSTLGTIGQAGEYASGNIGGISRNVGEIPGLSRFIARYPSYATQPLEEFYSNSNEIDTIARTANHLYKSNQGEEFTKFVTQNANKWALAPVYSETKAQLNELRTALLTIENDPYISGDSKREMRDYIMMQQIMITDNINKAVRKLL